jgi:hypothetical protein
MTPSPAALDLDDLARAVLIQVVPGGYRLIDESDSRFVGVRERFSRLALKHVGPKPSLVGFAAPGVDPRDAARAAAAWAAENLRPNAIQKHVTPGVLVIALGGPELAAAAGPLAGAAVRATVWTATPDGRAETRGGAPGCPPASVLRGALRRLLAGEPAPTIGQIDVAERALMYGRGRRPYFLDSPLLALIGFFCGLWALSGVGGLLRELQAGVSGHALLDGLRVLMLVGVVLYAFDVGGARTSLPLLSSPDRRVVIATVSTYVVALVVVTWLGAAVVLNPGSAPGCGDGCAVVTAAQSGTTLAIPVGGAVEVVLDVNADCPATSDAGVLQADTCDHDRGAQPPATVGLFHAVQAGTAVLRSGGFSVTVVVRNGRG